jgi:SAM-dependent methyltransferase
VAVGGDLFRRFRASLRRLRLAAARAIESIVWGGPLRERLLRFLLRGHYRSVFRRQWRYASAPEQVPHFADHRLGAFELATGTGAIDPYTRGFYSAETIREGDRLLDIGCGDGFFDRAFFSPRCSQIDAVDVEPAAIEQARRANPAPNVGYHLLDAVHEPFPSNGYDVIVWDGALGHFSAETTDLMLRKIRRALSPDGVFVGSESLGREGHDHLQFFDDLEQLCGVLIPHFEVVQARSLSYSLPDGMPRVEAFWRCATTEERLGSLNWHRWRSSTLRR